MVSCRLATRAVCFAGHAARWRRRLSWCSTCPWLAVHVVRWYVFAPAGKILGLFDAVLPGRTLVVVFWFGFRRYLWLFGHSTGMEMGDRVVLHDLCPILSLSCRSVVGRLALVFLARDVACDRSHGSFGRLCERRAATAPAVQLNSNTVSGTLRRYAATHNLLSWSAPG